MFCGSKLCRAAATLKPPLAAAIPAEATLQRFIGLDAARFHNVSLLNSIAEKSSGATKGAAAAANAYMYLLSHNPKSAVEEIDKVQSQITDPAILRFAVGIRLRAYNDLLDVKETALSVSGGATESEVSSLRSKVMEDYTTLKNASPGCWLVQLGYAEFLLYTGKVDQALHELRQIEKSIGTYLSTMKPVSNDIASVENSNIYSLVGLQLRRLGVTSGNNVGFNDPHVSNALMEFKDAVKLSLTDAEASEFAYVLEAVHAHHHFQDYFPYQNDYDLWESAGANKAKKMISEFLCPSELAFKESELSAIRKPSQVFVGQAQLSKLLTAIPDKNCPVASIRAALGEKAGSIESGDAFAKALQKVDNSVLSYETTGSKSFVQNRKEISRALARQVLFRTKVQIGVALTEKQKFHEAIDAISPVVVTDEYIYMWRAYLARSRAHKGLGNITESDKDLKRLKALKKSITDRTPYKKC